MCGHSSWKIRLEVVVVVVVLLRGLFSGVAIRGTRRKEERKEKSRSFVKSFLWSAFSYPSAAHWSPNVQIEPRKTALAARPVADKRDTCAALTNQPANLNPANRPCTRCRTGVAPRQSFTAGRWLRFGSSARPPLSTCWRAGVAQATPTVGADARRIAWKCTPWTMAARRRLLQLQPTRICASTAKPRGSLLLGPGRWGIRLQPPSTQYKKVHPSSYLM